MKEKEPKPFEMPIQVLDQINECSQGGFVLCYVDNVGQVNLIHKADNESNFLAMVMHLTHFVNSIHESSTDMMKMDIMGEEIEDEE